ncbi:MAG: DUF4863 family protein [Sandaracinus sp.]|nr:DUF4863 family protein [Sandaracinus sp.]
MSLDLFLDRLAPLLDLARTLDVNDPVAAKTTLDTTFPMDGETMVELRGLVRRGVEERWLAEREAGGVRFSRPRKASGEGDVSVDVVHMDRPGPGHTHPNGEIDLCFAVSGEPRFDGAPEGWTVYPPGSWHVPSVEGGVMDIVYFLPAGAIRFEPKPE